MEVSNDMNGKVENDMGKTIEQRGGHCLILSV